MLSQSASFSTRPRPPGRVHRRQSSHSSSKPVASEEEGFDEPPSYRKSQIMEGLQVEDVFLNNPSIIPEDIELDEQWIKDKSKEELSQLLLKAGGMIQRRQHELSLAAMVGKDLLQRNIELKTKYDAMLSRIPLSPSTSHDSKHLASQRRSEPWQTDDSASDDEAAESLHGSNINATPLQRQFKGHSRHFSASPSAISFLHSQNDQLLGRLATIEQDTAQAELEGKQQLRALEREIAALNLELESSRTRAAELEEQMNDKSKRDKSKEAITARLKALRDRQAASSEQIAGLPKMDFAPSNPWKSTRPAALRHYELDLDTHVKDLPSENFGNVGSGANISDSDAVLDTAHERKLIQQLYRKIAELEATNKGLLSRHLDHQSRLDRASKDADALNSVFDTIERDEMAEESLMRHSSSSSSVTSSHHHLRHSSHSNFGTPKRRTTRPRSISVLPDPKSPILRKNRSRSALTPGTFSPPSPGPSISTSTSLIDSPSFTRISSKTKRFRVSLHEELSHALCASFSEESSLSQSSHDVIEDGDASYPRSESQIDAAVFALRENIRRQRSSPSLALPRPLPLSCEMERSISPGPPVPGAYDSPQKLPNPLPPPEDTLGSRMNTRLRKSTSLGDIGGQVKARSIRSRRKASERIEGLDLAAVIEDDATCVDDNTTSIKPQWTALLMEVWIILQFCVVLAIFVFSMARKGPRGVIRNTQKH